MKFFKAIFGFLKKLVSKLIKFIKKYWVVILAILVVWFAPQISAMLLSSGAPAWMSSAFTWIATNATPLLQSVAGWAGKLASSGMNAFSSLSFGQQAALALGAVAMIDPESATEVVGGLVGDITDVVGVVAGAAAGGLLSSPVAWVGIGLLVWALWPADEGGPSAKPLKEGTARAVV